IVSNERYSASSRTGLYVLMKEFRMCCSMGLFAAASKSSQSAGSCSTMRIAVLHTCGTPLTFVFQMLQAGVEHFFHPVQCGAPGFLEVFESLVGSTLHTVEPLVHVRSQIG